MDIRNILDRKMSKGLKSMLAMVFVMTISFSMSLTLTGCGKRVTKYENVNAIMGTMVSQTVYANVTGFGATARGENVVDEINQLLINLDSTYSWRRDTAWLACINAMAGAEEGYKLTSAQAKEFETLLNLCKQTDGAFDISLGALTKLWNIDQKVAGVSGAEVPSEERIQQVLLSCGFEQVKIICDDVSIESTSSAPAVDDSNTNSDSFTDNANYSIYLPAGMSLDMGGVAKGIASNQVMDYLKSNQDVHGAVISLGGNIITYGDRGDGSSWNIGIVNPLNPETNIGYLTLKGSHMVITSGDYERFFEVDGQRFHHILDPKTGYPASSGLKSVTIWCQDGIVGDALSTACFVVGADRALELAEQFDVEILMVTDEGEIILSDGMEQVFTRE